MVTEEWKMDTGVELTEADRSYLVETIQEATAGLTDAEKLQIAAEWQWMANELRRAVYAWQSSAQPSQLSLFPE